MTEDHGGLPIWSGPIDLGKLAELLGADGLWLAREAARNEDSMCTQLAGSPASLIEYCRDGAPEKFAEYAEQEERRRLGRPALELPGEPTAEGARQIARVEAERLDRHSRGERGIQHAAAQRVARDLRLQFLQLENKLSDRARALLARPDFRFVGVRGTMLSDRIDPRFADEAEFDWFRCRVVVPAAGTLYRAERIVWEHVSVSCVMASAPLPLPAPMQDQTRPPAKQTLPRREGHAENSDEWHVDRILEQGSPVRPYVLAHDKDVTGPNPEAKVRRLQDKVKKRRH